MPHIQLKWNHCLKDGFWSTEELAPPARKYHDIYNPEHPEDLDEVKILTVQILESCERCNHIRIERPSLTKDAGHYNLPCIWNNVLGYGP